MQNGTNMDKLDYRYDKENNGSTANGPENTGWLVSNKLYHVYDDIANNVNPNDIDDQSVAFNPNNATINQNNFQYDEIGNLTHDASEEIDSIQWDVYGKIQGIKRIAGSTKEDLGFYYDATGNRIMKLVIPKLILVEFRCLKPIGCSLTTYAMPQEMLLILFQLQVYQLRFLPANLLFMEAVGWAYGNLLPLLITKVPG